MVKKGALVCTLLIVLLFIFGCGESQVIENKSVQEVSPEQEKQVSITVTLNEKPTIEILNSLEKEGLKVENIERKIVTGKVSESKLDELKNKKEVVKVEEKKESRGGQLTYGDTQNAIDEEKVRQNITGAYVQPLLTEQLDGSKFVPMYIRLRSEAMDNRPLCINEITSRVSNMELKFNDTGKGGIVGEITEQGVNKLKS